MNLPVVNIIVLFNIYYCTCLQVIMERANITHLDTRYIAWGKVYVTRFGRKSPYYLNVEGQPLYTWNNNMTIHLIFYEYLHNEYRRSFVEMHLKLCDAVNGDPYVGQMLKRSGVICPLPPRDNHLMNMTIEAAEFPNVWPFRKAMVEANLAITDSGISMARISIYITFLQKKRNRK